jgi:hypothetical protein
MKVESTDSSLKTTEGYVGSDTGTVREQMKMVMIEGEVKNVEVQ